MACPESRTDQFLRIYAILRDQRGHQHWWPASSPFEVAVGAVLTQNTSWINVERAIGNLQSQDRLSASKILELPIHELADLLRPSGFFNVKARRLRALVQFLLERADGDPALLPRDDPPRLRRDLLAVPGVGRETADSIMLYAVGIPVFVIDAYTRRLFGRLGLVNPMVDYDILRAGFEAALRRDVDLYNDFHAQIVAHAKQTCRARPLCEKCSLVSLCPSGTTGVPS